MARAGVKFVCQQCGYEAPRWLGRCPECGSWASFVEEQILPSKKPPHAPRSSEPTRITEVAIAPEGRFLTGIGELDRVLGGGIVPGTVILLGGDPGIGKSTLLTQVAGNLAEQFGKVLYASGEESLEQIRLRADRLKVRSDHLYLLTETDLSQLQAVIEDLQPDFLMVDSIQTLRHPDFTSIPGTVSQVRACAGELTLLAKHRRMPVFLVGHVTKEGSLAGPMVLEHIVDTVLYFEGERNQSYRILRAVKNRFGSTNEIGLFEMTEEGLREVTNPSEHLLSGRAEPTSGSVVTATLEGTRPILVEVQALVVPSYLAVPRRVVTGLDYNRTLVILAVLEKRGGLRLGHHDLYINIVGGLRLVEPSADLAVALAVASSLKDVPLPPDLVALGEIGLGGELRPLYQMERRLIEAARLGFRQAIIPKRPLQRLPELKNFHLMAMANLRQALTAFIPS